MAKREEELKEIRAKTTEEINEEVVDLKGELLMLRLQKSARNEFKSSEFRRMRKRVLLFLLDGFLVNFEFNRNVAIMFVSNIYVLPSTILHIFAYLVLNLLFGLNFGAQWLVMGICGCWYLRLLAIVCCQKRRNVGINKICRVK